MKKLILALLIVLALSIPAYVHAQNDVLIEIERGRTEGFFTKTQVFQRAILSKPDKPTDTAVLFFRGYPGIARIKSIADKQRNLLAFMRMNQHIFNDEAIALVVMDCPTDQWNSCYDSYRSSNEHADDVRSVITRLKDEQGISKIYLFGHSLGTISSRWLAKNLGNDINGSIHSASINLANPKGYGSSVYNFPYDTIVTPILHVHNENDACKFTPYSAVKKYAGENLVTVRGGVPEGDPCGGSHLHSYLGREELVVRSIISWIKTKKVDRLIGE